MKIAVVTSSYPHHNGDPAGHFVRSEVQQLMDAGHQVWVLCPGPSAAQMSTGAAERVVALGASSLFGWPGALTKLRRAPWRLACLPSFIRRGQSILTNTGFDRVIAHWLLPCAWPLCAPVTAKTPHLTLEVVVHGSDARLLGMFPTALRAHILGKLREAGATLRFVAPHLKLPLRTPGFETWLDSAEVRPCPIDIDAQSLPDGWLDREHARRALGVPADTFLAVVVGRLIAQKRVERALAVPLCSEALRVVVGSGPLETRLRKKFPRVRFTGHLPREQTLRWLASADVLLNASRVEGLPTVVREARSLGVTVWTAPFEGAREWAAQDPGIRLVPEIG